MDGGKRAAKTQGGAAEGCEESKERKVQVISKEVENGSRNWDFFLSGNRQRMQGEKKKKRWEDESHVS